MQRIIELATHSSLMQGVQKHRYADDDLKCLKLSCIEISTSVSVLTRCKGFSAPKKEQVPSLTSAHCALLKDFLLHVSSGKG